MLSLNFVMKPVGAENFSGYGNFKRNYVFSQHSIFLLLHRETTTIIIFINTTFPFLKGRETQSQDWKKENGKQIEGQDHPVK